jgi:3-hydroxy-9,10-secoandrosta-1,3,5(10)-triene-9,17-dione monooxygenase reductase component
MSTAPTPEHLKATVGKALGRIPSGVFILTTRHDGESAAMMVSWAQQVAFEPPAISIAMHKDRPIRQVVRASGRLALAVVAEGDNSLLKKYARGVPPGQDPFDGVEVIQTSGGLTVPKVALAWLEGRVIQTCEFGGDHELLIAQITDGAVLRDGGSFTHLRGNGFHY